MKSERRRVSVILYGEISPGKFGWKDPVPATFHQWGNDYEEFESGPGNFTIAVVELDGGKVEMVRADLVTFIS